MFIIEAMRIGWTITVQAYIQGELRKHWEKHLTSDQILLGKWTPYSTNIFSKHLRYKGVLTSFQYELTIRCKKPLRLWTSPLWGVTNYFFWTSRSTYALIESLNGVDKKSNKCDLQYLTGLSAYMQDFLERFRRVKSESKVLARRLKKGPITATKWIMIWTNVYFILYSLQKYTSLPTPCQFPSWFTWSCHGFHVGSRPKSLEIWLYAIRSHGNPGKRWRELAQGSMFGCGLSSLAPRGLIVI